MNQKNLVNLIFDIFSANSDAARKYDPEAAYKRFQQKRYSENHMHVYKPSARFKYIAAAVSAACLLTVSIFAYSLLKHSQSSNEIHSIQVVEVPDGSRTKISLPDGSIVWLNGGSSICYDSSFGKEQRAVSFDGEGYFEITKNKNLPFTVNSGKATVNVLGTKFNFRNYDDECDMTVSLLEGRVSFSAKNMSYAGPGEIYLVPNQQIKLDKASMKHRIMDIDASYSDDWVSGRFYFHGDSLDRIVSTLNHYFGTDITISSDESRSKCFYGYYKADGGVLDILDKLSLNSFDYEDKGDGHIIIR